MKYAAKKGENVNNEPNAINPFYSDKNACETKHFFRPFFSSTQRMSFSGTGAKKADARVESVIEWIDIVQ